MLAAAPIGRAALAGRRLGKTYADFQAHIAALATGGVATWGNAVGSGPTSRRVTAAAATGAMYNTPWGDHVYTSDILARVIQHSLPSEAVFNAQVAAGREIFIRTSAGPGLAAAFAVSRNGYTSLAFNDGNTYNSTWVEEVIYWDGTQAQQMTPRTQGGPTPYIW